MTRSLSEVEAVARAAARGAGRDWGLEGEAAWAARWLAARGADPCAALLAALDAPDRAPRDPAAGTWDGPLCGLRAGVVLADFAHLPPPRAMRAVVAPMLLRPFAAERGLGLRPLPGADVALVPEPAPGPCATRLDPDPHAWAALEALAERSRAPASHDDRAAAGGGDDRRD